MYTAHVLMPAYNAEDFITAAIHSVMTQSHPDTKLLIYNDGSTDDTQAKIREYVEQHPEYQSRIRVKHREKNAGIAETRRQLFEWSNSHLTPTIKLQIQNSLRKQLKK